ncbi:MAG: cupin domain-containing protein [Lentisphaeria bacterium]|nr:cupin domain-containing protein [Lentisphaeria bacterium]MBP5182783.1 cupin domain-containing protein [Lentisphaeria bacterium]
MHRKEKDYTLELRPEMKGGKGTVKFEHIWKKNSNEEMFSSCRMFSRITLAPGCSVGRHSHKGEEEIFYILSGQAKAWDNGEWVILSPGDSTICRSGEEHSMECYGDTPCVYLAVIPVY